MNQHNTTKHNNVTTYSYVKTSLGNDLAKQGDYVITFYHPIVESHPLL